MIARALSRRATCRPLVAWLVLALMAASASSALAQTASTAPPPRPVYQQYRYDEDWSALKDPALRHDRWDPVKYIPLHPDGWYLSVGGETRWRYEHVRHPLFGAQPDDRSGYVLQRHLLHTDWHLGTRVRAFAEVQSGLETGRLGGPRVTDEDTLDLHQAFIDVIWHTSDRGSLTTRVGRQEVAFGAGRLISAAEGLNVRRSFEGARLMLRRGAWTWNATALQLVAASGGVFDDTPDPALLEWGAGVSGPLSRLQGGHLAAYYIGVRRKAARFDQGTADARRHSTGVRVWGARGSLDYDEEAIVQVGDFGGHALRAYALASDAGWTMARVRGRPRVGLRVFAASGDRDPAAPALHAFDPLFPGIAYSGRAGIIGPTNLVTVDPSVAFTPRRGWRVSADWAPFWRMSTRDAVYGINVGVLRTGQRSRERFVGSQATVELETRLTPHLTVWSSIVWFHTGAFLEDTPPDFDTRYAAAHASYRF